MFLNNYFLGARIWIWLYMLTSIMMFSGIVIYFFRERILKKYYLFRFPEKTLRVYIHYPNNKFKVYYRLIPDTEFFKLKGLQYSFNEKNVNVDNIISKYDNKGNYKIVVDKIEYDLLKEKIITLPKRQSIPEIHYFYNVAYPIEFSYNKRKVDFSAKQLNDFKENDLFNKLLTLSQTDNMLKFLMIVVVFNLIATLFLVAKYMELI